MKYKVGGLFSGVGGIELGFSNVVPHASSNGIDIISAIFGNPNFLGDANSVAGTADIELVKNDNSILFSASGSNLSSNKTKDAIKEFEAKKETSTEGIAKYRYKEQPGDNPDTEDVVEKSGQVLNITDAVTAGKKAKLSISDYTGSSPLNTDTTQIVKHPKLPFDGEGNPVFKDKQVVPASTITRDNPSLGFRSDFNPEDTDKKEFDNLPDTIYLCSDPTMQLPNTITHPTIISSGVWSGDDVAGPDEEDNYYFTNETVGTYTVYYTIENLEGCTRTDSSIVDVSTNPSINFTPNGTTICSPGESYIVFTETTQNNPLDTDYNIKIYNSFVRRREAETHISIKDCDN